MTNVIRTRGRAVLFGSVLGSLVLAAALASPSSSATVRAPAVTGVTATQITLGTTTPLTGPAAPGYDEIAPATNAVFKLSLIHI